jgi:hypothetical protein
MRHICFDLDLKVKVTEGLKVEFFKTKFPNFSKTKSAIEIKFTAKCAQWYPSFNDMQTFSKARMQRRAVDKLSVGGLSTVWPIPEVVETN